MKKQRAVSALHRPLPPQVSMAVLVGLVVITGIVLIITFAGYKSSPKQPEISYSKPTPTFTPNTVSPTVTVSLQPTNDPHLNIYTSQSLGISFSYPVVTRNITPHEVGSKIFLGYDAEQYIQVFHLPQPASNMYQAVRDTILKGYSEQNCPVASTCAKTKNECYFFPNAVRTFASNIEVAYITFPFNDGSADHNTIGQSCPNEYVDSGGLYYFIMDRNHPSTLLFISEGKQPLGSVDFPIASSIKVLK